MRKEVIAHQLGNGLLFCWRLIKLDKALTVVLYTTIYHTQVP
jgi:hypothetical protein